MAEERQMKCLRCGHEYKGPYDKDVPIERTCPNCRSNSVRALKPEKK
jgi:predicted  nucleic acid-binding Zn-ribbon protein